MANKPMTVSDVAALIHTREELRGELRLLALHAYEQWCELEARLEALEERMDRSFEDVSNLHDDTPSGTVCVATAPKR